MPPKPKLATPIIVEGKYDKIKLETIIDALIIPTDGFRIFKDRQMRELIKKLATQSAIAVLTDSDKAGFIIRGHLSGIIPPGKIIDVYIPDLPGKEKRKAKPSKEGKLGVEGAPAHLILKALEEAGLFSQNVELLPEREPITTLDMYEAGLSGGVGSRSLRAALINELGLPARISAGALPEVLTRLLGRQQFLELCEQLKKQGG